MTVTPLKPATPPAPDVTDNDRIVALLNHALAVQKKEHEAGESARGVLVVWLHEDEDGYWPSFTYTGMNSLEAAGVLHAVATSSTNGNLERNDPVLDEPA
jgi:hypothetical protein